VVGIGGEDVVGRIEGAVLSRAGNAIDFLFFGQVFPGFLGFAFCFFPARI
jgi:hypothetical protein